MMVCAQPRFSCPHGRGEAAPGLPRNHGIDRLGIGLERGHEPRGYQRQKPPGWTAGGALAQ
jgi:hypothetical protein